MTFGKGTLEWLKLSYFFVLILVACQSQSAGQQIPPTPDQTSSQPPSRGPISTIVTTPSPVAGQNATVAPRTPEESLEVKEYPVPLGSGPHDVAPATDGGVWHTAQRSGELGHLDPATGATRQVKLGAGSSPHGVMVGPDGAPWVTDSGLNAIVRLDPVSEEVRAFPLPKGDLRGRGPANLNTATFDRRGALWFTGQNGIYGRLDPHSGKVELFDAPKGRGPYGIATTPDGEVYYVSLAGSYLGHIDLETGKVKVIEPPTRDQGARRVWSDSKGRLWISEWNAGQVGMFDPAMDQWREWRLPGNSPQPYSVYVDNEDSVWLSDFGANALVRFVPEKEQFEVFSLPGSPANIRQMLGRPGEMWGAESGTDKLVVVRKRQ